MTRSTIFEAAGGEPAFLALTAAHHQRCLADEVLEHPFSHAGHPQHVERLAGYWMEVFGGPPRYSQAPTEPAGSQSMVQRIHAGNQAQDDMPDRFLACFLAAMDDVALPSDPELRTAMGDYMRWAVADVHRFNPQGSVVPADLAIPRWSWAGLIVGEG